MSLFTNYKKIEHNSKHYKTEFELHNIPVYIANSIRRSLSSIIPIVTFDDTYYEDESIRSINIKKNTSALHDQFLSHRLSLVPINMELSNCCNIKTKYNEQTGNRSFDFTDDSIKIIFAINIINNQHSIELRDKDGLISITTEHFIIKDDGGNIIPSEELLTKDIFTDDSILLNKLKFNINDPEMGEELHLECFPTISIGKINSRNDPTGTVTYQLKIDTTRIESVFTQKIAYLNKERKIKDLEDLSSSEIKDIKKSFNLLDIDRVFTLDSNGNPNKYELSVESIGFMNPDSIIYNTICSMILLIKDILNSFTFSTDGQSKPCIDFTTNDKITISELDSSNVKKGININIKNENHTLGNMLSMMMRDLYTSNGANIELDILKYVAYKMEHPAIEEIDIIIIPNEYENSDLIKYINKLLYPSIFGGNREQVKEMEKKDSIYLNTILSVLLFIKTINICTAKLLQIKSEFVDLSNFSTTYENAGYEVEDTLEYFMKNTDIIGNLTDITEGQIDFTSINQVFNKKNEE